MRTFRIRRICTPDLTGCTRAVRKAAVPDKTGCKPEADYIAEVDCKPEADYTVEADCTPAVDYTAVVRHNAAAPPVSPYSSVARDMPRVDHTAERAELPQILVERELPQIPAEMRKIADYKQRVDCIARNPHNSAEWAEIRRNLADYMPDSEQTARSPEDSQNFAEREKPADCKKRVD